MRRRVMAWVALVCLVALAACFVSRCGKEDAGATRAVEATASPTPTQTATVTPTAKRELPVYGGTPVPERAGAITAENAGRVQQLARWGRGFPRTVGYVDEGRRLVVVSSVGVTWYDSESLEEQGYLADGDWSFWKAALSPNGEMLASGAYDGSVRVWRLSDGARMADMIGHADLVSSVAFSSDGATLASGSDDGTVRL